MKGNNMKMIEYFSQFYYSACGRPSKYRERTEQVLDAYYIISMLQGVNLLSLLLLSSAIFSYSLSSRIILIGIFCLPLLLNYFFFLRRGKIKIILTVDGFIKTNKLKPKIYIIWYSVITIVFMALSGLIYYIIAR